MTDGITYKAGKAFKHFTSERAAIYFTGLNQIWNYTMRNVSRNGLSNVQIEWTPEASSIPKRPYPEVSDIDPDTRLRWSALSHSVHNRWQLHHHEEWLYQDTFDATSRYVLIQNMAFVTFPYPTGDVELQRKAHHDALAFADANTLKTRHVGTFYFLAAPAVVYFTAPLQAAGWATGDAAAVLFDLVERSEERRLDAILTSLAESYLQDYTVVLEGVLNIHEAEEV